MLIQILLEKNVSASKLCSIIKTYPQIVINAKVNNSKKCECEKSEKVQQAIKELEKEFAGNGRVVIRPSGTEPLVRVMIEGENQSFIKKKAEELVQLIEKELS